MTSSAGATMGSPFLCWHFVRSDPLSHFLALVTHWLARGMGFFPFCSLASSPRPSPIIPFGCVWWWAITLRKGFCRWQRFASAASSSGLFIGNPITTKQPRAPTARSILLRTSVPLLVLANSRLALSALLRSLREFPATRPKSVPPLPHETPQPPTLQLPAMRTNL